MSSLLKEVEKRLDIVHGAVREEDDDSKVFTVRLPISLIENLENIGKILQMKRTEVARMILTHGVEDIIKEYNMKFESHGMSFKELYEIETGEKKMEYIDGKLVISEVRKGVAADE